MSSEVAEKCCIAGELSILIYNSFNKTQVALKSADQLPRQSQVQNTRNAIERARSPTSVLVASNDRAAIAWHLVRKKGSRFEKPLPRRDAASPTVHEALQLALVPLAAPGATKSRQLDGLRSDQERCSLPASRRLANRLSGSPAALPPLSCEVPNVPR